MKSAISSFVILISLVSVSAFAAVSDGPGVFGRDEVTHDEVAGDEINSNQDPLSAYIIRTRMDSKLGGLADYNRGNVTINFADREIHVTLYRLIACNPEQPVRCPIGMPAPYIIKLPLVSQSIDRCGNVIYTAERDQRPVDGLFASLIVRDERANRCVRTMEVRPATHITYETIGYDHVNGGEISTRSFMYANELEAASFAL